MTPEKKTDLIKIAGAIVFILMFSVIVATEQVPPGETIGALTVVVVLALVICTICTVFVRRILKRVARETYEANKDEIDGLSCYLDDNVKTTRDIFLHAEEIKRLMLACNMISVKTHLGNKEVVYWLATANLTQPKLQVLSVEGWLRDPKIICEI